MPRELRDGERELVAQPPRPIVGMVDETGHLLALIDRRLSTFRGVAVEVRIEAYKSKRSERANAYYWSTVLDLIAKDQEMTPEQVHDAMCEQFLPNESKRVAFFNRMTGEALEVSTDHRRSSKLTGGPFYDFVERVRLWAVEFLGVVTPDPDPAYWRKRAAAQQRRAA